MTKDKILATLWGILIIGTFYWLNKRILIAGIILWVLGFVNIYLMYKWGYFKFKHVK